MPANPDLHTGLPHLVAVSQITAASGSGATQSVELVAYNLIYVSASIIMLVRTVFP